MKKFVLAAVAALTLGAATASAATYQQQASTAQHNSSSYNVFAGAIGGDGGGD